MSMLRPSFLHQFFGIRPYGAAVFSRTGGVTPDFACHGAKVPT